MKTPICSLALILAVFMAPLTAQEAASTGFVDLFPQDGTPQGWQARLWSDISKPAPEGAENAWVVKDGVLHGGEPRGSWLISDRSYADFQLQFEFKLGPQGNSGCALRTPLNGDPAFDALELQMADLRYNEKAKPSELTGGLYRALAPKEQVYKPEEWNRYEITLRGSKIRVELNGTTILDHDLSKETGLVKRHNGKEAPALKDRPLAGHIGFQNLSRGGDDVMIRNAKIRELKESVRPGINENFLDPGLKVPVWVNRFEVESREIFSSRKAILAAIELKSGEKIADIGAGTGLFMPLFSKAVGEDGKVFAVDLSAPFVKHLKGRAKKLGLENVEVVQCTEDSVELPENSIDVAFVCDTYHHFEYPTASVASLRDALKPGGRLVIIDFERIPGKTREWVLNHVRAGKEVFTKEIESVGFVKEKEVKVSGLKENYTLIFRSPD